MPLKRVCSVCKKVMGMKAGGDPVRVDISHGLCPKCARLQTIEELLVEEIEAKVTKLFGVTEDLEEAKYVLRDGTLLGHEDMLHFDVCLVDEIAEHILLTLEPGREMTLEEAKKKHPTAGSLTDLLDMEIDGAILDACPDTFLFITGAGRVVPDAGGYYFNFSGMPSRMQAAAMSRALKQKPSVGVEVTALPNYVYLTFHRPTPTEGILKQIEERGLKPQADLRGTTGKVPKLTTGKELEQAAIKEFGITENPLVAGYLLKDGRFLDFSGGDDDITRARDHREVVGLFSDQEIDFVREKHAYRSMLMDEFMARTGAIRIMPEGCAAESPITFPTRPQARSLNDYALVCQGTILLEIWRLSNPNSTMAGFFTAGSADDVVRMAKRLAEHPERFGEKPGRFVLGKADWGLEGLHGAPHGSVCRTSVDDGHDHGYTVDQAGHGSTSFDHGHAHNIVAFEVQPADVHTHRLIGQGECIVGLPHLSGHGLPRVGEGDSSSELAVKERGVNHLGELEPPIDKSILVLVDELIGRREQPRMDALRRAAGDLKEKVEKLAAEAGVEVRYAEGILEERVGPIGLQSMIELPEKVNVVRLRPPTPEEKAEWEAEKRKLASELEFKVERPFILPPGALTFKSIESFEGMIDLLEQTMADQILDWLESLGDYPSHIKVELRVANRWDIRNKLSAEEGLELPMEAAEWNLELSSPFYVRDGTVSKPWTSEPMVDVTAEDINWVMKRFDRPPDGLEPVKSWPVGMIETFNNAWDAFGGERNDNSLLLRDLDKYNHLSLIDVYDHFRVSATAWNLAALYTPEMGFGHWFAAELTGRPTFSKTPVPNLKDTHELINKDTFVSKGINPKDIGLDVALTNAVYLNQDWPMLLAPHFWKEKPGLFSLEEAFKLPASTPIGDIVHLAFEIRHVFSGLSASFAGGTADAFALPTIAEILVCVVDKIVMMKGAEPSLKGWVDVDAPPQDLLARLEDLYFKRDKRMGPPIPEENFKLAVSGLFRGECPREQIQDHLVGRGRPRDLSEKYTFSEDMEPMGSLDVYPKPIAGAREDPYGGLFGLGQMPTASDVVTSIVAHLQAIHDGRLEQATPESEDAAVDGLLRAIKEFTLRLEAACACETGFEWCCPPERRVLPVPPLSKNDEDDLAGIRAQLRRLGGYAEEGVSVGAIFIKGRSEVLVELKDRAGQFSFRGKPKDVRNQLSTISPPPDTGRLWQEGQIRSFWYVLASNQRFKLDEAGWKWSFNAPPEFFGCTFISKLKKHQGWVSVNYEWGITSSKFTPERPDKLIHINTGLGAQKDVFIPFPIFDRQKEMTPEEQRALMRCIALEANAMVPDGLFEESKVMAHVRYGSEKVTGKEAESMARGIDNIGSACREVTVDEFPTKRKRTVTLGGIHGFPGCCGVNNG